MFNSKFEVVKKKKSLQDRLIEIMQFKTARKKRMKKINRASKTCGTSLRTPIYA